MKVRKKEHWLNISFKIIPLIIDDEGNYQPNHQAEKETIASFDFPNWICRKHDRFWRMKHARLIILYPNHYVDQHTAGYSMHGNEKANSNRDLTIRALKGQVTKYENIIRNYESERKKELFWEPENDERYQNALAKIEMKRKKLKETIKEKEIQ